MSMYCSACGTTKNRLRQYYLDDPSIDFYRIYGSQGIQYNIPARHINSFDDIIKHFHLQETKLTTDSFFYWLQGYFELSGDFHLDLQQITVVEDHMKLVEKGSPSGKYMYFKGLWDANLIQTPKEDKLDASFIRQFLGEYFTNVTKPANKEPPTPMLVPTYSSIPEWWSTGSYYDFWNKIRYCQINFKKYPPKP